MPMPTICQAFIGCLFLLFGGCQNTSDNTVVPATEVSEQPRRSGQPGVPKSINYFSDAEQKLAFKDYSFAAAQLNKGIVAYRVETGKLYGNAAKQANKAIDVLTRLRSHLRNGRAVNETDLRQAIQQALAVEGANFPLKDAAEGEDLAVPVGN